MLSRLHILNYGLIDQFDQHFEPGLNIITGETGTGKSMIIGALGLILGGRSDSKVLRNPSKKCILEADFTAEDKLREYFVKNDLDWSDMIVIRREISPQGRSRAFVNDTPVNLDLLKQLNAELIDIHTQEQTFRINSEGHQLYLLDLFADSKKALYEYKNQYAAYNRLNDELFAFENQIRKDKAEFDFLKFQFDELSMATIKIGEIKKLEQDRELLVNRVSIKEAIEKGKYLLTESDPNIIDNLHVLNSDFEKIQGISDWLKNISERLSAVLEELKDLNYEFSNRSNEMEFEGNQVEAIDQRLSIYYQLESKYNLKGEEALLKFKAQIEEKINRVDNFDFEHKNKIKSVEVALEKLLISGNKLNRLRQKSAPGFEKEIEENLKLLGINYPKIRFDFLRLSSPGEFGLYQVELLFSSNPDVEPNSVGLVASGGEKSRLMLVIKSILGHRLNIKTIVFDEIDTGISGQVAIRTGQLLESLGDDTQVISITHLSQVASKGKTHFKVSKQVSEGKTNILISKLNRKQRIEELAEMISGKEISSSARKTANELLK